MLILVVLLGGTTAAAALGGGGDFVQASEAGFALNGKPFFVVGVNNHYLPFATQTEVERVIDDSVALGANVIRTILQPVIGSLDGTVPTIWDWHKRTDSSDLGVNGTYLLYWDNHAAKMAINEGPDGMQKVDFLLAAAKQRHLKLLISFLDFWPYTGGAQQMRAWYGSRDEYTFFFDDPRTRQDYKDWVKYVVNRRNTITGVQYKNDPTIFGWDLMNEPTAVPKRLARAWTQEMATYVKSQDPNHLVSSGSANVTDRLGDLSIPSVDFGTWHGYPLYYKLSVVGFDRLITEFCGIAAERNKPVVLEEFGYARSNPDQAAAYRRWLGTLTGDPDCAGWVVWRLVSRQQNGSYPEDEHDQFDVHNDGGPLWGVLKAAAAEARRTRGGPEALPARQVGTGN